MVIFNSTSLGVFFFVDALIGWGGLHQHKFSLKENLKETITKTFRTQMDREKNLPVTFFSVVYKLLCHVCVRFINSLVPLRY